MPMDRSKSRLLTTEEVEEQLANEALTPHLNEDCPW